MLNSRFFAASTALSIAFFPAASKAADEVRMMFDWIPGGIHSAWYAGATNGCFEEQDIEFTFDRGAGSVDTVAKVASGLGDIGMADFGTMMLGVLNNGAEVKALMPIYSNAPFGIMTVATTGINSVADLEGRKLAAGPGDAAILLLPLAMELAGRDFSQVETVNADFSALLGLLLQGQVDGHTTFLTTSRILSDVVRNAGQEPQFVHFGESLDMYGSVLFGNAQFLAERPDVARRAMDATQCTLRAAQADPEAAIDALLEAFPEKNRAPEFAALGGGLDLIFDNAAFAEYGFDWDETRVSATYTNTMRAQGQDAEFGGLSDYVHQF